MVAVPVLTNSIADLEVLVDLEETTVNLFDNFDDPYTTGLVARFELFDKTFPNQGITEVLLFDQAENGAPITVENFANYVEDGDYVNSIIHRAVPEFVVQGGGFIVDGLEDALAADDPASAISNVPLDEPIVNEFSPERSNVAGTIAMAKLGNNPDSATSQWFFNLADNSENLDNQNGGFTVFGELLSESDFEVIDAIAALPTFDASNFTGEAAFTNLPLMTDPENPQLTGDENFVRYESISIVQKPELQFTVTNNSNPDLVTPSISDGELRLDYVEDATGTAEMTVQATNLVGETVEDTFSVTVEDTTPPVVPPTATDDSVSVDENESISLDVLLNDSFEEGLSAIALETNANNGTVEIDNNGTPDNPTDDRFIYTPNAGFNGSDSFSYTLTDNEGNSSTATVSVTVNAVNDSESSLGFGSLGNDEITTDADSLSRFIFSGAGEDTIDNQNSQQESTRLYGGDGDDSLIVGSSDRAFGGSGNDTLDASLGDGQNRLYGGEGDDNLIVGSSDRAIAGEGNDTLTLTTGGDNLLSGGTGNDEFRLESENLPTSINTITDFTSGSDQMIFVGFPELDFTNLILTPSNNGEETLLGLDSVDNDLILLQGVSPESLTATDFNFMG
ncbi:peptidyl-prolyl cis-trans isomerase cyclophilin type [Halothece sp. PCC 7418]|uniref:peptidylprolyl isomerase n=1 Tax=Halothece sp. (strain PCC 7418) TaxID=65093 RepID=UPI0002A08410|nr:peptidylprolyl isomerase [Halothece sp. PCC 7418]AFZ45466.1 peptidyl-prolyl cis-trans isomerase cyclophilin type [Halothece sp. PCC 7418]